MSSPANSSPARRKRSRFPKKLVVLIGVFVVFGIAFMVIDLSPNLDHVDVRMLSGPEQGNYFPIVERLAKKAAEQGGRIENKATGGSGENLAALAAAADSCDAHFALVQDGVPPPEGGGLSLIGRLRKSESMFFIGRGAGRLTRFLDLAGMRVGVGPEHSGTDHLARRILESPDFQRLGLSLENHPIAEQLDLLSNGGLDLGVFVVDEDAALIRDAVRDRGLELAPLQHLDVVARQHDFLWHGRIGAGQFDPIRVLPPTDTRVLRVATLVVGNGCADHATTVGLLTLLAQEFPGFIKYNRENGKSDLFSSSSSSQRFFENGGPDFADVHAPWLVNIMPPSNWVYIIMTLSLLLNFTTFWHRFRLWRIDANTDAADQVVRAVLGERFTPTELRELSPAEENLTPDKMDDLAHALVALDKLRAKCRKQANSMMVPMGQEWIYRYSEQQMEEMLTALRVFQAKAKAMIAARDAAAPAGDGDGVSDSGDS